MYFFFSGLFQQSSMKTRASRDGAKKSRGLEIITCRSFFNFLAGVRIFASFLPPLYNFCFHFTLGNTNSRPVRSMFAATLRKWHENKIRLHSLLKIQLFLSALFFINFIISGKRSSKAERESRRTKEAFRLEGRLVNMFVFRFKKKTEK